VHTLQRKNETGTEIVVGAKIDFLIPKRRRKNEAISIQYFISFRPPSLNALSIYESCLLSVAHLISPRRRRNVMKIK
jgi:hypothetical protein